MPIFTMLGLSLLGIVVGILAALLGVGGGLVIVPVLNLLGVTPLQATATSLIGVFLTATSASIQNLLMEQLPIRSGLLLAVPALLTIELGVRLANILPPRYLLLGFAVLLIFTLYLMQWKQQLKQKEIQKDSVNKPQNLATLAIGLLAGILSSLFGVGGGAVMVPLQILVLGQNIKDAVRTSLGAIVIISLWGIIRHALAGNVLWQEGIYLGVGGLLGAQFGAQLLPQLPEQIINYCFCSLLLVLAVYMIGRAIYI